MPADGERVQQLRLFPPHQRLGVLVVGDPSVDAHLLRRIRRAKRLELLGVVEASEACGDASAATGGAAAVLVSMQRGGVRAVQRVLERIASVPLIVVSEELGDDGLRALEAGAEEVVPVAEATTARLERAVLSAVHRRSSESRERRRDADPLTGLATRTTLEVDLPDLVERGAVAVLYCDLDRFKAVNDNHGHAVGDLVLREAAARLERAVRSSDLVVRMGGDEFVVVVGAGPNVAALAEEVGRRIVTAFSAPFAVGGHRLSLSASVGLAVHRRGESAKELVVRADRALYLAKRRGKSRVARYDDQLDRAVAERATSAQVLAEGLRRDLLAIEVRPVVDPTELAVFGHLYRPVWGGAPASTGRAVPAEKVGVVAASSGAAAATFRWTLGRMAAHAAADSLPGGPRRRLVELPGGVLGSSPGRLVDATSAPAEELVVVVDERDLADVSTVRPGLLELARRGVRVAVGRFGVEHASLGLLDRFPFDAVWLDRQMVDGAASCPARRARLVALASVAEALGQHVVVDRPTVPADLEVLEECCRALVVDGAVDLTSRTRDRRVVADLSALAGGSLGLPAAAGEQAPRR